MDVDVTNTTIATPAQIVAMAVIGSTMLILVLLNLVMLIIYKNLRNGPHSRPKVNKHENVTLCNVKPTGEYNTASLCRLTSFSKSTIRDDGGGSASFDLNSSGQRSRSTDRSFSYIEMDTTGNCVSSPETSEHQPSRDSNPRRSVSVDSSRHKTDVQVQKGSFKNVNATGFIDVHRYQNIHVQTGARFSTGTTPSADPKASKTRVSHDPKVKRSRVSHDTKVNRPQVSHCPKVNRSRVSNDHKVSNIDSNSIKKTHQPPVLGFPPQGSRLDTPLSLDTPLRLDTPLSPQGLKRKHGHTKVKNYVDMTDFDNDTDTDIHGMDGTSESDNDVSFSPDNDVSFSPDNDVSFSPGHNRRLIQRHVVEFQNHAFEFSENKTALEEMTDTEL